MKIGLMKYTHNFNNNYRNFALQLYTYYGRGKDGRINRIWKKQQLSFNRSFSLTECDDLPF